MSRTRTALLAASMALVSGVTASVPGADAQTSIPPTTAASPTSLSIEQPPDPPGRRFPAPLVATVRSPSSGVPEEAVTGFAITPGLEDASPVLAVSFADPFSLPAGAWRVSLLVGDPDGSQVRTSLRASNGTTSGRIESGDPTGGGAWTTISETEAVFDPSGFVVLTLDTALFVAEEPDAPVLAWVEVVSGTSDPVVTPWFTWADIEGAGEPGLVPSGRFGSLAPAVGTEGAAGPPTVVDLGAGPEVGMTRTVDAAGGISSSILVRGGGLGPMEVDGVAVVDVVDLVRIAPDYVDDAILTPYVELNRTTGDVRLVDGRQWPPVDATGDATWLLATDVPDALGRPVTVLDLSGVLTAVGASTARDAVGLGVTRTWSLADGRKVVADGVMGDVTWLDTAVNLVSPVQTIAPATIAPTPAPEPADEGSLDWILGILAAVLLLTGLSLVLAGRRRRAAGSDEVRIPPHVEGQVAMPSDDVPVAAEPAAGPASAPTPLVVAAPATKSTAVIKTERAVDLAAAEGGAPAVAPSTAAAPTPVPVAVVEPAPDLDASSDAVARSDVMAALDDDLDDLAQRLRNLDGGVGS